VKPPKKMTKAQREKFLAMQAPSTRALLTDNKDEAKAYFQSLSGKVFVTQEDMDSGKSAKPKEMDTAEMISGILHRQKRMGTQQEKGYLGEIWGDEDIDRGQELKDKAVDAFMNTPGITFPSMEDFVNGLSKAAEKAKSVFRIRRTRDKVNK
jgi:hypothetical protein